MSHLLLQKFHFLTRHILLILIWSLLQRSSVSANGQEAPVYGTIAARDRSPQQRCGFTGNNDIYGVGIRIGYYSQALSIWIANYFVLSEAKILRSMNLLFFVAGFTGLLGLAHDSQHTYAVETYLLLQLVVVTWYTGVLNKARFSRKCWRYSPMRGVISSLTILCVFGYNVWFWWTGLDRMERTPCGTYVFFFAKVELYGWFRTLFKALAIPCIIESNLHEIIRSTGLVLYMRRRKEDEPTFYKDLKNSLRMHIEKKSTDVPAPLPSIVHPKSVASEKATNSMPHSPATHTRILELAIQKPLPDSPDLQPHSPQTVAGAPCQRTSVTNPMTTSLPSFQQLLDAEKYVSTVLSTPIKDHSSWHYSIQLPFAKAPFRMYGWKVHSPRTLYKRCVAISAQRPFRLSILVPLFHHIKSLRRFPFYNYLPMIQKAILAIEYKQVDAKALQAVLDFHVVQFPSEGYVWTSIFHGVCSLSAIAGLILSIELAITWNGITGINSVGQVGQLIPAVLGLGGLTRVFWAWWTRGTVGIEEEDGIEKVVRECATIYADAKACLEHEGLGIRVPEYM